MQFFYPAFLWAWALLLVPLIIHFFNFRRYKTVYFSNVAFLQSVKKDAKSRSRLQNILLMLFRMLVIFFLVLAFARPYIPLENQQTVHQELLVSIYIDNSFSMEAEGSQGMLFEQAKVHALELSESFGPNTRFILLSNAYDQHAPHGIGKAEFREELAALQVTHITHTLSELLRFHKDAIAAKDSSRGHMLFIFSDFQKSTCDWDQIKMDSAIQYFALPFLAKRVNNVAIDSVWFDSPGHYEGKKEKLWVQLINYGTEDLRNVPIQYWVNEQVMAQTQFTVDATDKVAVALPYLQKERGNFSGEVRINDYPVSFDNRFYLNYTIAEQLQGLIIQEKAKRSFPEKLLTLDSLFYISKVTIAQVPYDQLSGYDFVFIDGVEELPSGLVQKLAEYVRGGGCLWLIPPFAEANPYNALLSQLALPITSSYKTQKGFVAKLNNHHRVWNEAFKSATADMLMPSYQGYYPVKTGQQLYETLYQAESGEDLLLHKQLGQGEVYFSALPFQLDQTDLMVHPLIVPLLYNSALQSGGSSPLYHVLESELMLTLGNTEVQASLYMQGEAADAERLYPETVGMGGETRIYMDGNALDAGFYAIWQGEEKLQTLALNYNRLESDLRPYSLPEIKEQIASRGLPVNLLKAGEQFASKASEWQNGKELHRLMLWMALLFMLLEILLLRFYIRRS